MDALKLNDPVMVRKAWGAQGPGLAPLQSWFAGYTVVGLEGATVLVMSATGRVTRWASGDVQYHLKAAS